MTKYGKVLENIHLKVISLEIFKKIRLKCEIILDYKLFHISIY